MNLLRALARWLLDRLRRADRPRRPHPDHLRVMPPPVEPDCACDACTAQQRRAVR